jgi:hypothetical protein
LIDDLLPTLCIEIILFLQEAKFENKGFFGVGGMR